jgi:hypothetical protein
MSKARLVGKEEAPQRFVINVGFKSEAKVEHIIDLGLKDTISSWHYIIWSIHAWTCGKFHILDIKKMSCNQ